MTPTQHSSQLGGDEEDVPKKENHMEERRNSSTKLIGKVESAKGVAGQKVSQRDFVSPIEAR